MGHILRLLSNPAGSCHILRLPDELLTEIAFFVADRHQQARDHFVIDSRSLFALSSVSRTLNPIAMRFLYEEMAITSKDALRALQFAPQHSLAHTRELNVFMDANLLDSFRVWAFAGPSLESPFSALAGVLCHTKTLAALRIRVGQATGPRSAWRRTFISRPGDIPFGRAFSLALAEGYRDKWAHLSSLTTLELDAFSDVAPLLFLTPNLKCLRLEICAGYAQSINAEVVDALQHVPHLKELHYSPTSLRVTSTPRWGLEAMVATIDPDALDEQDRSAELVHLILRKLRKLECLDLRRRWHGEHDVIFPPSEEPVTPEVLAYVISEYRSLKSLALPTSVSSTEDHSILRSHLTIRRDLPPSNDVIPHSFLPSPSQVATRRLALQRTTNAEEAVAEELMMSYGMKRLMFTRPVIPTDRGEVSVCYKVISEDNTHPATKWISTFIRSSDDSYDALPGRRLPEYSICSLRHWKLAMKNSDMGRLLIAVLCGILLSEVLRSVWETNRSFAHVQIVIPAYCLSSAVVLGTLVVIGK